MVQNQLTLKDLTIVDVKKETNGSVARVVQPTEPLKNKVIEDLNAWIDRASIGHYDNYANILHTISLIEAWNSIEPIDPYFEYFLYAST